MTSQTVYIRFGDMPETGGRSLMQARRDTDLLRVESGVSAFEARAYDDDVGASVYVLKTNYRLTLMFRKLAAERRRVYLASGKVIGKGGDFEPVLDGETCELTPIARGSRIVCPGNWNGFIDSAARAVQVLHFVNTLKWERLPANIQDPGVLVVDEFGRAHPEAALPLEQGEVTHPEDLPALVRAGLSRATYRASCVHGEDHWRRCALVALWLVSCLGPAVASLDPLVVFCFALMHDSQRLTDGNDTWHAFRAAHLAEELLGAGGILSEEQLTTLVFALERHNMRERSADPTVGVCWDADRLCLPRVGTRIDRRYLSTRVAMLPEIAAHAGELHRQRRPALSIVDTKKRVYCTPAPGWDELIEWYTRLLNRSRRVSTGGGD